MTGPDPTEGEAPAEPETDEEGDLPTSPGVARAVGRSVSEQHLRTVLESLVFVSDHPITVPELARITRAEAREVRKLLNELQAEYLPRGIHLDEVAGAWLFRSSAGNAPFVRELLQAKPVRLSRAQVETLAIVAYRQPVTRPEIDEVRGVDTGSALKILLERDLVRTIGRREEPGRPLLYGTSRFFLEFFGLRSLRDLPMLREYTELSEESQASLTARLSQAGVTDDESPAAAEPAPAAAAEPAPEPAGEPPSADEPSE
jgi:segregation and condensation protein B